MFPPHLFDSATGADEIAEPRRQFHDFEAYNNDGNNSKVLSKMDAEMEPLGSQMDTNSYN